MLTLKVISQNENSFIDKLLNAYQKGFDGRDFLVIESLQKREDEIFKKIHTLIYECGLHDQKCEKQRRWLNRERRWGNNITVEISYLFIGKDLAVYQGMKELKALVKKQEKKNNKATLPGYNFAGSWQF